MKRNAANWSYYVQVDCVNGAENKDTHSIIERIVRKAASGIAPTSSTSAETAPGDATDGSQPTPSRPSLKDSTSTVGKIRKPYL